MIRGKRLIHCVLNRTAAYLHLQYTIISTYPAAVIPRLPLKGLLGISTHLRQPDRRESWLITPAILRVLAVILLQATGCQACAVNRLAPGQTSEATGVRAKLGQVWKLVRDAKLHSPWPPADQQMMGTTDARLPPFPSVHSSQRSKISPGLRGRGRHSELHRDTAGLALRH